VDSPVKLEFLLLVSDQGVVVLLEIYYMEGVEQGSLGGIVLGQVLPVNDKELEAVDREIERVPLKNLFGILVAETGLPDHFEQGLTGGLRLGPHGDQELALNSQKLAQLP
jgi:hypothetical protein